MSAYTTLSPAQRRFVDAIACGRTTATEAIRALRPSLKRPDVLASKWRALPEIRAAIAEREHVAIEEAGVTQAAVLLGLARNAFYDARSLYHADGRAKAVHELDDATARLVQGVDVKTQAGKPTKDGKRVGRMRRIKYSLPKRNEALTLLGRHLKLFPDRHEVTGKDGEPLIPALPSSTAEIARRIAFVLAAGAREPHVNHEPTPPPSDPAIGAEQPAEQASQQASQ